MYLRTPEGAAADQPTAAKSCLDRDQVPGPVGQLKASVDTCVMVTQIVGTLRERQDLSPLIGNSVN